MPTAKAGYRVNGTKVPSVTTVISRFKDSGALLSWAFNQGQACERGEITGLYDKRDEACSAGTLAHLMVEKHINWEPAPDLSEYPSEIVTQAQRGFENYLQWQSDNRIEIIHQELQMVSESHRFGGCPDAIGINSKGNRVILDWKNSSSGPYVDWILQLAAYKILWEENHPKELIDGGYHSLRFSKENADFHHSYWQELQDAEEQFLLFLKAYELDKKLKKRL